MLLKKQAANIFLKNLNKGKIMKPDKQQIRDKIDAIKFEIEPTSNISRNIWNLIIGVAAVLITIIGVLSKTKGSILTILIESGIGILIIVILMLINIALDKYLGKKREEINKLYKELIK